MLTFVYIYIYISISLSLSTQNAEVGRRGGWTRRVSESLSQFALPNPRFAARARTRRLDPDHLYA